MHYNVIFDITQTAYHHWSDLFAGFFFVVAAIGFFLFHWKSAKRTGWLSFSYSVFIALFLLVWSLLPFFMFFHRYQNYLDIRAALQHSRCDIAEGSVTHLRPLYSIKGRGAGETFSVGGREFSYREGSAQNGFHQVGVIRDGLQVRIYYYDWHDNHNKDIARLEIAP
jgi:hypothetical protein